MNEQELNPEIQEPELEKIRRLRKEVISKIDKRFLMSQSLILFVNRLRDKYPNWKKWLVYHELVSSSPSDSDREEMIYDDFPGEDSVVSFLESLLK